MPEPMPRFEELRRALQADGADLTLDAVQEGTAMVRLILTPAACLECIMPKDTLEQMLLVSLRGEGRREVQRVELLDPRVSDAQAPHGQIPA